jgi:Flp pilus assembly protein TadD
MLSASNLATKYVIIAGTAIALSACASTPRASSENVSSDEYRDAIGVYSDPAADQGLDPIAAAAFWGTRYNTDQSDPAVAVRFSRALRKIGSTEEAVGVMQKAASVHADNTDVSLEYGKVLVEGGRAFEAVRYLETAVAKAPADWRALSAYGVALDQIGEHETARVKYDRALAMAPGEVILLNNKGLSYALDGNLSMARVTLRQAASSAGADSRIRQNLALVLALSGDMREAERLARSDLPPLVADNNIDVYRQLMNQPAYWDQYAAGDVETPNFDDVPAAPLAPSQKPQLREEKKPEEGKSNGAPVALIEAAPVTNASAVEMKPEEE